LQNPRSIIVTARKAIFVVDDDESMRISMKRLLRERGFHTRLFESGAALFGHGGFEDALCIILDINLGDASGIDLRRRLADQDVKVPVIYITGKDSPLNRAAAIESGCIAYLTKPFSAHALIEAIEKACAPAA
jgi:FixJ family two-component response regulator